MKRSKLVELGFITILSTTCGSDNAYNVKHCVDDDGVVLDERACDTSYYHDHILYRPGTTILLIPRWHYDDHIVPVGTRIVGGSYTPSVGRTYYAPSAIKAISVSRGGFGSTGRSFSSSSAGT